MKLPLRRFRWTPARPAAAGTEAPAPRAWGETLRGLVRHNAGMKAFAFVLALFVWLTLNASDRDAERRLEVPVVLGSVDRGLVVSNPPKKPVFVRVRGPRTLIDDIDERSTRLLIDMTGHPAGDQRIKLSAQTMLRPELVGRVKAVDVEPSRLHITVERLAHRMVPVHVDLAGDPPFGYSLAESHTEPAEVEITGPAAKLEKIKAVYTDPIDLRAETELSSQRVVRLAPAGGLVTLTRLDVTVAIRLEDIPTTREFRHVPVKILNGDNADIAPGWVDLSLRGPQRVLVNLKLTDDAVTVDASNLPPGSHQVDVRITVPAGLKIERTEPDKQTVRIGGGGH